MSLLLGTASWTDKPLLDAGWYPPEAKSPEARLRHYASQFPLVEADTTYYGLPKQEMVQGWADRTPDGFVFDVKAYSLFTEHPSPINRLPREIQAMLPDELTTRKNLYRKDAPPEVVDACWTTFIDALSPLDRAGKLGVVVFQFPKWVFPNAKTHRYLEDVRDRLGNYRGAVEFRGAAWMDGHQRELTLGLLGDLDLTYVCVDEPQGFASSVPPVAAATNDLAFVRFHGRNAETWEKRTKTSAERFDYWYNPDELDEWVPKIRGLLEEAPDVHLVMNTNNYDQGPRNLQLLQERLSAAGIR